MKSKWKDIKDAPKGGSTVIAKAQNLKRWIIGLIYPYPISARYPVPARFHDGLWVIVSKDHLNNVPFRPQPTHYLPSANGTGAK